MAAIGALVVSLNHRELGIGKIVASDDSTVTIEYFDSAADPVAERVEVPPERVRQAPIDRQQRVWFRRATGWWVGRIMEVELGRARVRPPGKAEDLWLGLKELYVRWDRPLDDPVGVMRTKTFDTPHFYFARRSFVDATLEQDAVAGGNRALTSSSIELYDHQIEVATRVLSDPVRRFLLADEVGMGKTIEAGIVIRQTLIDHGEAYVRVVAPARLCDQWRRELSERFFVEDFVDARVEVLPSFGEESWATSDDELPDLVILDEAHHVARWAQGNESARDRFSAALVLAHASPGLLLLSATPVAHNEATYLAMLNLLDPDNYRLDQLEEFSKRVEHRHEVARIFALFRPGQLFQRLERNSTRFRELLEDDSESIRLLDDVMSVGPTGDQDELDRRLRAFRIGVTDRHRIHHRMLRSRRDVAHDFPVRGRTLCHRLSGAAADNERFISWVDRWRDAIVANAEAADLPAYLQAMLDRLLAFPEARDAAIRIRLGLGGFEAAELSAEEEEVLAALPPGAAEIEVLSEALDGNLFQDVDARVEAIVDFVWGIPRRTKVVVFATYRATASRLACALREQLPQEQLVTHLLTDSQADCHAALMRFRTERACNVLVCDRSAEEGLNLQFADVLVHAELPTDPNRLEQRIGRLDRHGPDTPVENIVVADGGSGSYLDGWVDALADGLSIFDRSVSAYQFAIDRITPEFMTALLEDGPDGLATLASSVPDRLEEERREIAEQDQLDAIEAIELSQPVAEALRDADSRWDEFEDEQERLICKGKGQLRFTRDDHFQYRGVSSYWLGHRFRGGEPLIPTRDIVDYLNGAVSEQDRVLWASYDRGVTLRYPGTRLRAAGDPFIDGVLRYVRERDDRGRAYAFWRPQPDLDEGLVVAALRFDFIVEPGRAAFTEFDDESRSVLARRAASLLAPGVETAWIAPDGSEVTDGRTVMLLRGKYLPNFGHVRLGPSRWNVVDAALPGLDWEGWCDSAFGVAKDLVRGRERIVERAARATEAAERHGMARVDALRSRRRLGADGSALAFEERAAEAVREAVCEPRTILDAMGLVLFSRELPQLQSD